MMKMELLEAIKNQAEWADMLDSLKDMRAKANDVISAAHNEVEFYAKEVATILWDMFTAWAGIAEAEENDDYEVFDTVYDSFEDTGYIKYLVAYEDCDIAFLNPIPVEFFDSLEEIDEITTINVDTECDCVEIW